MNEWKKNVQVENYKINKRNFHWKWEAIKKKLPHQNQFDSVGLCFFCLCLLEILFSGLRLGLFVVRFPNSCSVCLLLNFMPHPLFALQSSSFNGNFFVCRIQPQNAMEKTNTPTNIVGNNSRSRNEKTKHEKQQHQQYGVFNKWKYPSTTPHTPPRAPTKLNENKTDLLFSCLCFFGSSAECVCACKCM